MIMLLWIVTAIIGYVIFKLFCTKRYKQNVGRLIGFLYSLGCCIAMLVIYYRYERPFGFLFMWGVIPVWIGGLMIAVALFHFYMNIKCSEAVQATYIGYQSSYGGNGISVQSAKFEYVYGNQSYCETSVNTERYQYLNSLEKGKCYTIYIDKNKPWHFLVRRRIHLTDILILLFGMMFCSIPFMG